MSATHPLQLAAVGVLVLVHLFAGRLRFLEAIPRSRWLSLAGGISVAYVFVHVFPELAEAQHALSGTLGIGWLEHHAYLVAMLGLVVFYGLERFVQDSDPTPRPGEDGSGSEAGSEADGSREVAREAAAERGRAVFALHLGVFTLYNALIGYLLVHRVEQDARGLLLFAFAYALHFIVNDHGLSQRHRDVYRRIGRWTLAAAVLGGWSLGLAVELSEGAVHALFALLAGATVLNVLKEELPEERRSRFLPFLGGASAYAALMLAL